MADCTFLECEDGQLIIEDCKQGPPGPQGPQGPSGSASMQQPTLPLGASGSGVADSLPVADYYAAKWIVHILTIEGTPRYRGLEVLGIYNGSTSFYNITGSIGESINVGVVVDLNGANLELQVTNNEAVSIEVRVLRLAIETP